MGRTERCELVSGVCRLTGNTGTLGAGWRVGGTGQTEASQKETGIEYTGACAQPGRAPVLGLKADGKHRWGSEK